MLLRVPALVVFHHMYNVNGAIVRLVVPGVLVVRACIQENNRTHTRIHAGTPGACYAFGAGSVPIHSQTAFVALLQ